jgi:hypothetical protein
MGVETLRAYEGKCAIADVGKPEYESFLRPHIRDLVQEDRGSAVTVGRMEKGPLPEVLEGSHLA